MQYKNFEQVINTLLHYTDEHPELHRDFEIDFEMIISAIIEDIDIEKEKFIETMQESSCWPTFFCYIFENFITRPRDENNNTFIDEYLAQQPRNETRANRQYLQAIKEKNVQMWEIVNIKSGKYAEVRLYGTTDKPIRIVESNITQNVCRWDCIAARIISLDTTYLFTGTILPIPLIDAIYIQRARASMLDNALNAIHHSHPKGQLKTRPNDLEHSAKVKIQEIFPVLLFKVWVEHQYKALTSTPPEIYNEDGETYQPARIRFPLKDTPDQIATFLDSLPELSKNGDDQALNWAWTPQQPHSATEQSFNHLGDLTLRKKSLELKVNSRERAEKGEQWLRQTLQDRVKPAMTIYSNREEEQAKLTKVLQQNKTSSENTSDQINAYMDKYHRASLDQPAGLLNDKTPRASLNDPSMQSQLVEWAKFLENKTLKIPALNYDFTWLWEELNIMKYR